MPNAPIDARMPLAAFAVPLEPLEQLAGEWEGGEGEGGKGGHWEGAVVGVGATGSLCGTARAIIAAGR